MGITQRRRLRQVVREAFLGLLFLLPVAAQADWLVLQTGLRIETKGPWTVKGKQVVYTSTDKVLRSMRLSEIDLPASTRASAVEPASKPKLYQDMGEAPDIATVKPPPVEFNRLNAWISNPNAPRVSGTVSAPTLRLSEGDLAREGMRILSDPEGVESELMQAAAQIDDQYSRCQQVHAALGDNSSQCTDDYLRGRSALSERVSDARAAVDAARSAQLREQQMEKEDALASQRVEQVRQAEESAARSAAEKEEAAAEPPRF